MAAPGVEANSNMKNATKNAQISTPLVQQQQDESDNNDKNAHKPLKTFSRKQLLALSKSPLVQPPPGMPELKDWFGDTEQHVYQKNTEPSTPNSARERRFRRDQEDGDPHSRNNFRPTASQPSQMGNFKHHSLRSGDRDRDGERDRDRDTRDKDGLRHLSDKYDRERLSSHPTGLRGKDRDGPTHVSNSSSTRLGSQATPSGGAGRSSNRDRKKEDDWRRDTRSSKDDRSEGSRRDREDRERPRSRVRDSSRSRREPSSSRRDRDRDDYRRDRDADRENDDDSRHWRDDGKRDERMAARRAERQAERDRERHREKESAWENGDRRWASGEDRDARSKKGGGRDKRPEEGRDRDGRGDREKEKEPAWMETYVPTPGSGNGILGGKNDGELDGIQAWKKERKEKEQREQEASLGLQNRAEEPIPVAKPAVVEKPLDEIQLFKMLMKKEEEKKRADSPSLGVSSNPEAEIPTPSVTQTSAEAPIQANTQPLLSLLNVKDAKAAHVPDTLLAESQGSVVPGKLQDPAIQQAVPPASIVNNEAQGHFNPPAGSRLLAFARSSQAARPPNPNEHIPTQTAQSPPPKASPDPTQQLAHKLNNLQPFAAGFSPFEEQQRRPFPPGIEIQHDTLPDQPRSNEQLSFTPQLEQGLAHDPAILDNGGFPTNKGSRFAKFFDGNKQKDGGPHVHQHHGPIPHTTSPSPGSQRVNPGINHLHGGPPDARTMDDIYAMLSNSGRNASQASLLSTHTPFNRQPQHNLHLLQQQLQLQQQQQQLNSRLEPLYESRLDDRNFVPDGMVPGLRTTLPRSRDPVNMYNEGPNDGMHYNNQRIAMQRAPDPHFAGGPANAYHQGIRNGNVPIQQPHYRGGPSPISNQHGIIAGNQQRLPPGLANLGARPPHEPSQLLGMPNLHGSLPINGSGGQQPFAGNFPSNGNAGFGGPQMRGPLHLPNSGQHQVGGHLNMEIRGNNQNQQFTGLAGVGSGMRSNVYPGQPGSGASQLLGSLPQMRQQPQQLPPGMIPHLLPQMHQQGVSNQHNQQSHDLMALLMGGSHRE